MNKSIYDKLKIIGIKTLRCGTHLFSFFPIKKGRVLLSSYLGESYSCNPKYISEYLQKNYPEKFENLLRDYYSYGFGRLSNENGVKEATL